MISKLKALIQKTNNTEQTVPVPDVSRVLKTETVTEAVTLADPLIDEAAHETGSVVGDPEDMAERAKAAIDDLRHEFDNWLATDLARLRACWSVIEAGDHRPEAYRDLFRISHDLRGAAVSYGYPAISRLCASLCTLLPETRPGDNSALIHLHVEACRAASLPQAREAGSEVANAVCAALEAKVNSQLANAG